MDIFIIIFLFVIGLAIGSFLNVCVYRLPSDEPIFLARSKCPECGKKIFWFENIPLLSYLYLQGSCRHCDSKISLTYPIGELIGGFTLGAGGYWWLLGTRPNYINFFVFSFFLLMCITISRIDLAESIIPNELNYLFLLVGLLIAPIAHFPISVPTFGLYRPGQIISVVGGALLGGGVFFALAVLSPLFYGKPALGMGDVKLMAAMGSWLGPKLIFLTIMLGSIIGALTGTLIVIVQGKSLRTEIPFGPYLCLGGIIALVAGHDIFYWYMTIL